MLLLGEGQNENGIKNLEEKKEKDNNEEGEEKSKE